MPMYFTNIPVERNCALRYEAYDYLITFQSELQHLIKFWKNDEERGKPNRENPI